jgi:hypothetical protein
MVSYDPDDPNWSLIMEARNKINFNEYLRFGGTSLSIRSPNLEKKTKQRNVNLKNEDIEDLVKFIAEYNEREGIKGIKEIKELLINGQPIGADGAKILQKVSLQKLDLTGCHIRSKGAMAIAENPHVRELILTSNSIDDEGLKAFADKKNFIYLDVASNNITCEGAKSIANSNIIYLNIAKNNIGEEGKNALLKHYTEKNFAGDFTPKVDHYLNNPHQCQKSVNFTCVRYICLPTGESMYSSSVTGKDWDKIVDKEKKSDSRQGQKREREDEDEKQEKKRVKKI